METEGERGARLEAQAELQSLDSAAQATAAASVFVHPPSMYLGISLIGPAAVFWVTASHGFDQVGAAEDGVLRIGAILMAVAAVAAIVVAWLAERRHPVQPKSPARGGPTSGWRFAAISFVILPFIVGTNLVILNGVYSPYLIGLIVYVVMAGGQYYSWTHHVAAVRRSG